MARAAAGGSGLRYPPAGAPLSSVMSLAPASCSTFVWFERRAVFAGTCVKRHTVALNAGHGGVRIAGDARPLQQGPSMHQALHGRRDWQGQHKPRGHCTAGALQSCREGGFAGCVGVSAQALLLQLLLLVGGWG